MFNLLVRRFIPKTRNISITNGKTERTCPYLQYNLVYSLYVRYYKCKSDIDDQNNNNNKRRNFLQQHYMTSSIYTQTTKTHHPVLIARPFIRSIPFQRKITIVSLKIHETRYTIVVHIIWRFYKVYMFGFVSPWQFRRACPPFVETKPISAHTLVANWILISNCFVIISNAMWVTHKIRRMYKATLSTDSCTSD